MKVKIINESGYIEALTGLSLSHGQQNKPLGRMIDVAKKLAAKDGGHNKFLESIVLWLDITAARYWWQQFDTYRVGVTKQSESTMHTLLKQQITISNDNIHSSHFEDGTSPYAITMIRNLIEMGKFNEAKKCLPESFLQRRIICTNYKALRNMILQRRNHKLEEWNMFCNEILNQAQHKELLPHKEDKNG